MNIRKYVYHIVAPLMLLLTACTFEPKDVYKTDVSDKGKTPIISQDYVAFLGDTIYVFNNYNLTYNYYSTNDVPIKGVQFIFDDKVDENLYSSFGTYSFKIDNISNGSHTLEAIIYSKAATGSLKDRVGAEVSVSRKAWTIIVDKTIRENQFWNKQNGTVMLFWNNMKDYPSMTYNIQKTVSDVVQMNFTTKANHFIDTTYVGEGATYTVSCIKNGVIQTNPSQAIQVWAEEQKINITTDKYNKTHITWNKSMFSKAIDSYILYKKDYASENYTEIGRVTNPNDTSFVTTEILGKTITIKLRKVPKYIKNITDYTRYETETTSCIGAKSIINTDQYLGQGSATDFIYVNDYKGLKIVNTTTEQIISKALLADTMEHNPTFRTYACSPRGKYVLAQNQNLNAFLIAETENISKYKYLNLVNTYGQFIRNYSISDNGVLLFTQMDTIRMYNTTTMSEVASLSKFTGVSISSNGQYILCNDIYKGTHNLAEIVGGQIIVKNYDLSIESAKYVSFEGTSANNLVIWDGTKLNIINCDNGSVVRSVAIDDTKILNIDYYNNRILTYKNNHLFIKDYKTGALIKDIEVDNKGESFVESFKLVNNMIFNNSFPELYYVFE